MQLIEIDSVERFLTLAVQQSRLSKRILLQGKFDSKPGQNVDVSS